MSFHRFVCWDTRTADEILRTEALEGSRATFLARHVPIKEFQLAGSRAPSVQDRTEAGLLAFLERPDLRHVLCVVEGEPGSGKSHLIRWLYFGWRTQSDLVVLIPRSQGSLAGTLESLRARLPEDLRPLFAAIGSPTRTSLSGRAQDFQSALAHSFDRQYFETPPALTDWDWAETLKISALLDLPQLRGRWDAPRRILETLSGLQGERHSRLASFTLADIVEFAQLLRPVDLRGIGPRAVVTKQRLLNEGAALGGLRRDGSGAEAVPEALRESETARLLEGLNRRLNYAVQGFLGISGHALKAAFLRMREELARRHQRLVLLFEDLTSMQGVEEQLLDVLIANSEAEENRALSDLVAVVGVTPAFFHKIFGVGNLRQRITLHVQFGQTTETSPFQDGFGLRRSEDRLRFASSYLRAIRAGLETLERTDIAGGEPIVNRCEACPHRDPCHANFGAFEGVGLYPFTTRALDHMYEVLLDPRREMTLQTPRGMLQGVLAPVLLDPRSLEVGEFPGPSVEHAWIPPEEGRLLARPAQIVGAQVNDRTTAERLRRLLAFWGYRDDGRTVRRDDGLELFAGLPRGVFDAFDLPWLGAQVPETQEPSPRPPATQPAVESCPASKSAAAPKAVPTGQGAEDRHRAPPAERARRRPAEPGRNLRSRLDQLAGWLTGDAIPDPSFWSQQLLAIIRQLPWRSLDIPPWLQQRLFTTDTVHLDGAGRADVRHFVVPREAWVEKGLVAFLVLRDHDAELDASDREFHRRMLARMLRRLAELVRARVRQRMRSLPSGNAWSPITSAAQVLLARAWLLGVARPGDPPHEQWNAILADEAHAVTPATHGDRDPRWAQVLARTGNTRAAFQEVLRGFVNLPQDAWGRDAVFADARPVLEAIGSLSRTLRFDPLPAETVQPEQTRALEQLAETVRSVDERLCVLAMAEWERLVELARTLSDLSPGISLSEYARRARQVADRMHEADPHAPQAPVSRVRAAYQALAQDGLVDVPDDRRMRQVEACLDRFQAAQRPKDPGMALAWALEAPSADLTAVAAQVGSMARGLDALRQHAAGLMRGLRQGSPGTLQTLHGAGARLERVVRSIQSTLAGQSSHNGRDRNDGGGHA